MDNPVHLHTFHIPVMGLAFTVDTPVKVARFGISSVISIIEDTLVERMRQYYYRKTKEPYRPINVSEPDYRAKRVTDYLNLINRIVNTQIEKLRESTFEAGSELVQYFDMLPESSPLKKMYRQMQDLHDQHEREKLEQELRKNIRAGCIDVNIMTKLDNEHYHGDGSVIENGSDAVAALRGYANSDLTDSSIIFSAGMNPRLFNYIEQFDTFTVMKNGSFEKKIVIKVSDHRSAIIQGKYLAKKGIWVSEFRIESGLNCGGHAFASDGYMLGPILEEFKTKRESLTGELFEIYCKALTEKGKKLPDTCPPIKVTVQGGIGTAGEDDFLRKYYQVDATGWGSPFLLVPEAVVIDYETLQLLAESGKNNIILSNNSPLGVPFYYLKGTSGEKEKYRLAAEGKPGCPCTEKFLQINTEFPGKPLCTASVTYINRKLQLLAQEKISETERKKKTDNILTKECLCIGLSNAAVHKYDTVSISKAFLGVTVCPGPNLAYFNKIVSLKEMVDHIYGRMNLLSDVYRPHVFINELKIYMAYLNRQLEETLDPANAKQLKYYKSFCKNLQDAVEYYISIADKIVTNTVDHKVFLDELQQIGREINDISCKLSV